MLEKNTLQTFVLVACFWTVILILSLYSYIHLEYQSAEKQATQAARSSLEKDQAIRYWVSRRGGLYGQLNEFTQPSPHLAHIPMRDIQTPAGDMTLLNPALILRLIMEEYESLYGVKGRTVGLKVLREENMADEWEANVLDRFQADKELKEYVEINDIDGVAHLRMMTPMYMKENCMKCHAILGYKVGDLRGGVNVSVPLAEYYAIAKTDSIRVGFAHGGIWLLGLFGIGYVTKRSVKIEELRNRDFHELKETEKALREGDKHFRALFDQSSFGVAKIDSNTGRFIKVNKRYCDMVGYSEAEMLEMGFQKITVEEDLQLDLDNMDRLRAGKTSTFQMEKRYQSKDGSDIWVKLTVLPLWDQGKEPDFHLAIVEDITENKNIRVALEESEALLEKAQILSQIGHWKLDTATGEVTGSDELFRIFGLSKDEATLDAFVGVVHPDERDSGAATIQRGIELGESWDIESRLICSDGTEKWVRSIGEANTDKDGNVVQLVGTVQDITKLKITSNALLESQLWMTNIYNSLDEAVLVVSPDREIVNVNDAAIEMFGYSVEEISNNSTELFHVDHQHFVEFGVRINQSFSKGETAKFEFESKRKSGEIFPSEHTVSLLKDSDGEVKGIVSVIKDITERRLVEQSLQKSEARLKEAQRIAKVGVWELNLRTHELVWSDEIFRIFEHDKNKFNASYEGFIDAIYPEDRDMVDKAYTDSLINKQPYEIEHRLKMKDGNVKYVRESCETFFDSDGNAIRSMGTVHDITESKLADQELRQFKGTLDQTLDCVFMFDSELRFFYVNDGAMKQVGYSRKEMYSMHPYDIKPDFSEAQFRKMIDPLLSGEKASLKFEAIHQHKNGLHIPVEIFLQYIVSGDGAARYLAIVRDISERRRTEEELARIQGMLKQANIVAKMGAWDFDLITNEMVWNDITKEIYEVGADFKPNIDAVINFHKEGAHRDTINHIVTEAMQKGGAWDEELVIVTAKGNEKWVRSMGQSEFRDGTCMRLYGSFQDVSERKLAEQSFNSLAENMQDGVLVNSSGEHVFVNASMAMMLGYDKAEELIGTTIKDVVYPDELETVLTNARRRAQGKKVESQYETLFVTKTGEKLPVELNASLTTWKGKPAGMVTIRDITERKENELELQKHRHQLEDLVLDRTLELQKSLAEKEVLLKEVHHRVKNNMAMVSAFIQLQMKQVDGGSSIDALSACENRIQAMSMVHKRLYQSSDFTSIDMQVLISEICNALFKKSDFGNIELDIQANEINLEMDAAIPCAMIINELFSNSLKYAFKYGQPGMISIHMQPLENNLYRIRVSDDGAGLSEDVSVRNAETLGLQLVNVFVDQLGGEIEMFRECGVAFEIVFPDGKAARV